MYGKAVVQLFVVTFLDVALHIRGSACAQEVSMVGLVHVIVSGFNFFKNLYSA